MKLLDVEFGSELGLGALTKLKQLELSDLLAQCLTGPCDVAVRLPLNICLVNGRMLMKVVHDLLPAPMFRVKTRIYN